MPAWFPKKPRKTAPDARPRREHRWVVDPKLTRAYRRKVAKRRAVYSPTWNWLNTSAVHYRCAACGRICLVCENPYTKYPVRSPEYETPCEADAVGVPSRPPAGSGDEVAA